jgi:monoamine oxidase
MSIDTDVLVLGAGFSGLLTASKLKDAGVTNFKMIDGSGDFGGTVGWASSVVSWVLFANSCHSSALSVVLEPLSWCWLRFGGLLL